METRLYEGILPRNNNKLGDLGVRVYIAPLRILVTLGPEATRSFHTNE
jgi:hypothetical protein